MANEPKYIEPGETRLIVQNDDTAEYWATVLGTEVQLGRTEASARQRGRRAPAGDRGPLRAEAGEEVYVFNPEDGGGTAEMYLDHNGFFWDRQPRSVIGGVQTSTDNEASPASDDYCWSWGVGVDVSNGYTIECDAPDRADTIVASLDDANNSFEVAIVFEDGNGNEITRRDKSHDGGYAGSSTEDVFAETVIASPHVTVEITGAATSVDLTVYAR